MVDVVWWSAAAETIQRGYWDQGWLEHLFDRSLWRPPLAFEFTHRESIEDVPEGAGAVVVVAGRWNVEHVEELNKGLARLAWALVVITGDEEGVFPVEEIEHERLQIWRQTPRPSAHRDEIRAVGDFWPQPAPALLAGISQEKTRDWFFAGQVNTEPRAKLAEVLERRLRRGDRGRLVKTEEFGAGIEYGEYLAELARAKVAPCPSGPFTPDTFRLFEALEAGCVPVVEREAPNVQEHGYWSQVLGSAPIPTVGSWSEFPRVCAEILERWPAIANRVGAWWQGYKRDLAHRFEDDLRRLSGEDGNRAAWRVADDVTVLIPTSPAPAHPDTSAIETVVESIRAQEALAGCEILVMLDGLHESHADRWKDYEEYQRRLLWLTEHRWHNVAPVRFGTHQHQAAMTRATLERVRTSQILFVEHDTPLVGAIDWLAISSVIKNDHADVVRLHHEAEVLPEHRHMMLDLEPKPGVGSVARVLRTVQWSQRPHLASTAFYRRILREYFGEDARTMIEDVMHGVVHTHWREFGDAGWDRFRLWLYAPETPSIKRSGHLDARGDAPHVPNVWKYDGETPFGAPAPS